jgi:thiosulfate dehydrogenase (quinone) large subunit
MNSTSYLLIRLAIGMSAFGHGVVRLFKLSGFSRGMVATFQKSYIPEALVVPFSYILPFAELIVGLLLLIGLFTREAAIAGAVLMILLIFGSTSIENWDAIPTQLIHIAFLVVVLQFLPSNSYAVDKILRK